MNVALCEYAEKRSYTAGNKARTDVVQILLDSGYKHIPLYKSKSNKMIIFFQMAVGCVKTICTAEKNETVLIQYPYYPAVVNDVLVRILLLGKIIKRYRIGMLIHDSIGLRNETGNFNLLKKEIKLFDRMDYVVCHNERMIKAFQDRGGSGNYKVLGPFDYLYTGKIVGMHEYGAEKDTVIIAGNLSKPKCGYVYHLSEIVEKCHFNLYGVDYSGIVNERISYKGSFPPDELISHMEGDFGLVWDGDAVETCTGVYGEYLKYNNPHKFSLYLAAGIPLIVWSQSALADSVRNNNLGICVNSLRELDVILAGISMQEYKAMVSSVLQYRKDIISGNRLKHAINNSY